MSRKEEENKRKLFGSLGVLLFSGLTLVVLFAFNMPEAEEEEEKPPVPIMTFDFSGSTKKGGSGAKAKAAPAEKVETPKADPVKTQKTKSATKKTSGTKSTKPAAPTKTANNKALANGAFGGNNNGSGSGNDNGDGGGLGNGESGPGVTGRTGKLTRGAISRPEAQNPIEEEGQVAVEITVDRSGKVISAKALRTHPYTTSNNPAHYTAAVKAAKKYKFSASSSAKEYEKGVVKIRFTLR